MFTLFFQSEPKAQDPAKKRATQVLPLASNDFKGSKYALSSFQFTPDGFISSRLKTLGSQDIGFRLWTNHQSMHQAVSFQANITAATLLSNGQGQLMIATSSDLCIFLVLYDAFGYALKAIRLNQAYPPSQEKARVKTRIHWHNFCQLLSGDLGFISKMELIYCKAHIKNYPKQAQESFLLRAIRMNDPIGMLSQDELEKKLVQELIEDHLIRNPWADGSEYTCLAIQTFNFETSAAFLLEFYHYHGQDASSDHLADMSFKCLMKQMALDPREYARQRLSVENNLKLYYRDNAYQVFHRLIGLFRTFQSQINEDIIKKAIGHWIRNLEDERRSDSHRAHGLYHLLSTPSPLTKNISILAYIQSVDKSEQAETFLKHIACIVKQQLSGLLPLVSIVDLVLLSTGESIVEVKLKRLPS